MSRNHLFVAIAAISLGISLATEASYYTYDGEGNNLINKDWGSVGELFLRQQVPAANGYGSTGDMTYAFAKNPREISLGLTLAPHRNRRRNHQHKTDMLTYIGQFFNHDIDLREEGSDDASNRIDVEIDHCDPRFNKAKCSDANSAPTSFSMKRSKGIVSNGVLQQVNTITAYLDGSVVYGSDAVTADKLRSRYKGQMLVYNGELPKNTLGVTMANPAKNEPDNELRAAGDVRANVNPILLAIQSLFVREHNRLAEQFASAHPFWSDEEIYQESRKWNVAYMQSICFYEYIPLLGIQLPTYRGYKSTVNPGIDNFFATVSYRYGHSEVNDIIARVDDYGNNIDDDYITLMEVFFYPSYGLSAGIEPLLRGASFYRQAEVSPHFASSLQNYLFGRPAFSGADLLAINIQRGRDHGMPSYNEARSALGLVVVSKFSDITSDVYLQKQLEEVYGTVDNVEPYVGGCAEDSYRESNFGELFYTSLADQYTRIRDGDRFYFENTDNGLFTEEEINQIRGTGLRDIILRNTDIQTLPQNIYVSNPDQPWPLLRPHSPSDGSSEADTGSASTSSNEGKSTLRSGMYDLEWSRESISGEDYLQFKLVCSTVGWVGLGIAQDASSAMIGADIMIAEFVNGAATVSDYWAETFAKPVLDTSLGGSNDVELISGSETNGVTTITFRRKVVTGDTYDRDFNQEGATPIIYAWHSSSDELSYHTALNRGKTSIDFFYKPLPVPSTEHGSSGVILVDEDSDLSFEWTKETANGEEWVKAKMKMAVMGPSFMGLVIEGPKGGLQEADLLKVTTDGSGSCSLRDYWIEQSSEIALDTSLGGTDDSLASFCYISGGELEFELHRRFITNDQLDRDILTNAYTNVLFLWDTTTKDIDPTTMKEKVLKIDFSSTSWMDASDTSITTPTSPVPSGEQPSPTSPATPAAPTAPVSTTGEVTVDEGTEFVVKYELFKDDIRFDVSFKGAGFLAIGIPGPGMDMVDADVFIAMADDSGACSVGDYWSTTFAAPLLDSENGATEDLTDVSCAIDGDHIKSTFTRKLQTDDSKDRAIEPSKISFIYAFGTAPGGLQYHGPTSRGSSEITPDLSVFESTAEPSPTTTTTTASTTTNVKNTVAVSTIVEKDFGADIGSRVCLLVHTWMLGFGIGLFAFAGLCIERLGRGWNLWRKAQYCLQLLSMAFLLIAEILALVHSEGSIEFAHCVLAYLLLFICPFHGVLCNLTYRKDRFVPAWKKLNRIMDAFICTLGFFQFWLALRLLAADIRAFQLFYAYALAALVTLILTPRSTDRAKELPTRAAPVRRYETLEPLRNDSNNESQFSKSITEKIAAKNAQNSVSFSKRTERKSSLLKATSRNSQATIPAFDQTPSAPPSTGTGTGDLFSIHPDDFQEKINEGKQWTVISDKVYDMEKMLKKHPGGPENIEDIIGKDGTDLYMEVHAESNSAQK